jgi:hypothetical protein
MIYRRRLGNEAYTIALNFSRRRVKLPQKALSFFSAQLLVSSVHDYIPDRTAPDGTLLPWEGILVFVKE